MTPRFLRTLCALGLLSGTAAVSVAQTTDMSLTGGPAQGGNYPGFIYNTQMSANFFSGASMTLPAGSIWVQFTIPPGTEFNTTITPTAGWTYNYVDAQNVYFVNSVSISPLTTKSFVVPFRTVALVTNGLAGGQITIASPAFTDPNNDNNSFDAQINVANTPLPVQFSGFSASLRDCQVELNWGTASETNNDRFELERSADGKTFAMIGIVKSGGRNAEAQSYRFIDEHPARGHNFYRIRQVDSDGRSSVSGTEQVKYDCNVNAIEVYPNPVTDNIIYVKGLTNRSVIEVYSMSGQLLRQKETQNALEGLSLTGLADGSYQIRIVSNKQQIHSATIMKK